MKFTRLAGAVASLAVASVLVAAPVQASPPPAYAASSLAIPDGCAYRDIPVDRDWSAYEGKKVALVIHGWNGEPLVETAQQLSTQLPASEWAVDTFSYQSDNGDWPGEDSNVAKCLQATILEYANANRLAAPSVYLVTHSMGGVLARVALDAGKDPQLDGIVGGVVTIDTPHRGSPWGNTPFAELLQVRATSIDSMPAHQCLALHHPGAYVDGCDAPPAISQDIPILQVAGSATATRTLFMIARKQIDTDGDGIVWMDSQAGYRNSVDEPRPPAGQASSFVVRCEFDWAQALVGGAGTLVSDRVAWWDWRLVAAMQSGSPDIIKFPAAVAALGGISAGAPCGHALMVKNPEAITRVATQLTDWAKTHVEGWSISASGIGPFVVGETTWDDASALPGFEGDDSYWAQMPCVSGGWFGVGVPQDGISVLVAGPDASPGALDVVSVGAYFRTGGAASIPVSTADGIGLGTSEADVLRLHPEAEVVAHPLSAAITDYRVEDGTGRAMVFGVEDSVVTYISVGNIPEVYFLEGCA